MLQMDARATSDAAGRVAEAPHALDAATVAEQLATDLTHGLDSAEAASRLAAVGPNALARATRPPYAALLLAQLRDPLVALLVVAAAISFAIGERIEATAIAAIVVLNAVFGFVQELGAARAVLALAESIVALADVTRDGRRLRVDAADLVPGDLVWLREGDRVPADVRLVRVAGLECDESSLTGESAPVGKRTDPVPAETTLAERSSLAFAGTGVTRGSGTGVVVATGARTEQGVVATLTQTAAPAATPLQRRLAELARRLVLLGIAITLVLATAIGLRGEPWHEAFLVGVSVAVAAVPEGLAATVTIALALGARELAQRGAVVRELSAIETVGEATVVCADKTGTLTENRLRVERVELAEGVDADELRQALHDLAVEEVDPVDRALVAYATAGGSASSRDLLQAVPFDAERRRAGVIVRDGAATVGLVKGAPETVLALCRDRRPGLATTAAGWADAGLRVLLVARRELPDADVDAGALDEGLEPLGLVALVDPLREHAAESVAEARSLGLGIRMLTGDHPGTAVAIGTALGLGESEVRARCTPADKLALVEQLIEDGEIVVVTGDGINDAPALRRAHVGVAMGRDGTEAAREAASIVLTDDDFSTIVAAVREGRRIAANIRSFLAFLLSANLGEVLLFAVAVIAGWGAPLTVVQVLIVNLLTDGPPAVALARDAALPSGTAVWGRDELLGKRLVRGLVAIGALVGLAGLAAFLIVRGLRPEAAQTAAFATIAIAELFVVFSCRSLEEPPWRLPPNRWLEGAVAASLAVVAMCVYVAPLHDALGTVSLRPGELVLVLGLAVVPTVGAELLRRVAGPSERTARLAF